MPRLWNRLWKPKQSTTPPLPPKARRRKKEKKEGKGQGQVLAQESPAVKRARVKVQRRREALEREQACVETAGRAHSADEVFVKRAQRALAKAEVALTQAIAAGQTPGAAAGAAPAAAVAAALPTDGLSTESDEELVL